MEEIKFLDEEIEVIIASEKIILDKYLNDFSNVDRVQFLFAELEKLGYYFDDKSNLNIEIENIDEFNDKYEVVVNVIEKVNKKNPYKITTKEEFSGSFILTEDMTIEMQKRKIFTMMTEAGVEISKDVEYEIDYDEVINNDEQKEIRFIVKSVTKEKIDNEVLVGSGFKLADEDIYAAIQRNQGLDVRFNEDYVIVYNEEQDGKQEYKLFKISSKEQEKEDELEAEAESVDVFSEENTKKLLKIKQEIANSHLTTTENDEKIKEISKYIESLENSVTKDLERNLINIDVNIKELRQSIKSLLDDYERNLLALTKIEDERIRKIEDLNLMTDEEYERFNTNMLHHQLEDYKENIALLRKIKQQKKLLKKLEKVKSQTEKIVSQAFELDLTYQEYQGILNSVEDPKVFKKILENSDYAEILNKEPKDRTAKEKKTLRKQKKKAIKRIVDKLKESQMNLSVSEVIEELYGNTIETFDLNEIEALYNPNLNPRKGEEPKEIEISSATLKDLQESSANLPERVTNYGTMNNYQPLEAPIDMVEVHKNEETNNKPQEPIEIITLYNMDDTIYANKSVFTRFNALKNENTEVLIDNKPCYKLEFDDLKFIIDNQDNDYSPYVVDIVEAVKNEENSVDNQEEAKEISNSENINYTNDDNIEKILIYIDNNSGKKFAKKYIFDRFNALKVGEEIKIEYKACFELTNDDLEFIINNQDNDYSPYKVDYKFVNIPKKEDESKNEEIENITITLYRDLNDNDQIYADINTLNIFDLNPTTNGVEIENKTCFKISNDANQLIKHFAKESVNPKYHIRYKNIKLKQKVKPHVETILEKLTNDLDIKSKDYKRFTASNIKISDEFKKELKSGNYLYNIVHIIPSLVKVTFKFLRKLSAKLLTSKRAKKVVKELERRLDEEINEEELDVLFDEYKGSQLKTDMNNQINGAILNRLRRHGLEKVNNLNESIKDNYSKLFVMLGQIKTIDSKINENNLSEDELKALKQERKVIINDTAKYVKTILRDRKDANNLLSGGVHGLEEDFKAVATKLSYVGMRFSKNHDFDNELQKQLSEYGNGLNEALSNGDNEEIINNFVGLESCYYNNTKIENSIKGKRSVGSKYYTPLAEQFDYRDDPFIKDLFTTVALTSSAISAVNSYRVHQIESEQLLAKQQNDANSINDVNDSVISYANSAGKEIEGKSEIFKEGMKAQSHQDVLTSANTLERSALDMSNWSFNGVYHEADKLGHTFYNEFNQTVTNQINDITARYGSGSITQIEALSEIKEVANSAQDSLVSVTSECMGILKDYATSHPKFDLSAIEQSMEYIVANPDAITNMNQAMLDVTAVASNLKDLNVAHIEALNSLPSDMLSTIVCAASASSLALNISKNMNKKYQNNKNYGNEITDMMEEYLNSSSEQEEDEIVNNRTR